MDKWAAVGTLLLSGFLGLSEPRPDKTLHFVRERLDWTRAHSRCSEAFKDLATVSDSRDMALLRGLVDTGDDHAFIGLRRVWQWGLADGEDQRLAQVSFSRFQQGEPQELHTCGTIQASGEWATAGCSQALPFICQDDNLPERFVRGKGARNYPAAKSYCRKNYSDLARIRDLEENQRVASLCDEGPAWTGLKKSWAWSDGSFYGIRGWSSQDNGILQCAALQVTKEPLQLTEWDCNSSLPFFCYSFAQKKYTVKIKLSAAESGLDLAHSAADSITKLVQSKLSERGFSKEVRLTWRKLPQKVEKAPEQEEVHCPFNIKP